MKQRILMVIVNELQNAGVQNVIMSLVRELHEKYCFDILQFSDKNGYFDEEFKSYGGEIYRLKALDYAQHKLVYPYRAVQIKRALCKILKEKKYIAIHSHCGWETGICFAVAAREGIPCRIAHAHGMYIWEGKNWIMRGYRCFGTKMTARYATGKLACSNVAGKTLFPGAQFQCVLNPVDVPYYNAVKKIPHKGIRLLQIGYFQENKNQLFSLTLLQVLRSIGVDAHLTLIGYALDEGYFAQIKECIRKKQLGDFVTMLPSDADKREALAETDYLLFPSRREGLGLVALESQAAGVPCIMSDCLPPDANMGGVIFAAYDDVNAWADVILEGHSFDWNAVKTNLQSLSVKNFAKNIL